MPDYYLTLESDAAAEHASTSRPIRRPGTPNPVVDLFVYDVATQEDDADRRPRRQAVRQRRRRPLRLSRRVVAGRHASCCSTARTAGRTSWSSRRPNPATGDVPRDRPRGVADRLGRRTARACVLLKDGKRFIWESERNGWSNFYLYDLSGKLIAPLTTHTTFEVGNSSGSTRRPACSSTRRATATTT